MTFLSVILGLFAWTAIGFCAATGGYLAAILWTSLLGNPFAI